jgi:hypothetical protein
MRRPSSKLYAIVVASLACATAVRAGDVVVPLATHQTLQGLTYNTRVSVANPTGSSATFTGAFYAAGADGTTTPPATTQQTVDPGAVRVYAGVAAAGTTGMLALDGADALMVTSRLETWNSDRLLGSVAMPVITASTAFAGGSTAQLTGLARSSATDVTDLLLFNLAGSAAQCTVSVLQASGTQVGSNITLALAPRQRRDFTDALGILSLAQASDVRLAVTCDHSFWLLGVLRGANQAATLALPAQALSGDTLGTPAPPPPPPANGAVTFTLPGLFFDAKQDASLASYTLPANPGTAYRKAVVEFDLKLGALGKGNFTGVHSLRRPNKTRNLRVLYYGMLINNYKARTILDLGQKDQLAKGSKQWVAGHTYHLRFTYDVPHASTTVDIFENGALFESVSGNAFNLDLSANSNPLSVDFGMDGIGDGGGYIPPIGWQYSNLNVVLTP